MKKKVIFMVFVALSMAVNTYSMPEKIKKLKELNEKKDVAGSNKLSNELTDRGVALAGDLVKMRSTLAKANVRKGVVVDENLAKKTCLAVADKAKKYSEDEGFVIRFISLKPRNPLNAPSGEDADNEKEVLTLFDENRNLKKNWTGVEIEGKQYYRYMLPIFAEKACFSCHGEEKKVPKFIKQRYPADKSFNFQDGDLIGAVAVYTWKGF